MSLMRRAALEYAGRGWHVIPIWWINDDTRMCGCGDPFCANAGKHPLIATGRLLSEASCDPDVVGSWWTQWEQANIAVALGPRSGVLAIDLDLGHATWTDPVTHVEQPIDGEVELGAWADANGVQLPETLVQETGSGGRHLVYAWPPDDGGPAVRNVVGWLPGVDVKSDGGYILVAPSGHASGGRYRWLNDQPPAALNGLLGHLRLARGSGGGRRPGESGEQPVYDYREACRTGPRLGYRDDFFNKRAFELRRQDVTYEQAKDELRRVWAVTEQPQTGEDFTWTNVLDKLDRVWRTVEPDPLPDYDPYGAVRDQGTGTIPRAGASPKGKPTDLGNAQRFVDAKRDLIRCTQQTGWHIWDGRRWGRDTTKSIIAQAVDVVEQLHQHAAQLRNTDQWEAWHQWAISSESESKIRAFLNIAQGLDPVAVAVTDFDVNPNLLCCANGVIDLTTGELGPFRPELMISQACDVEFHPKAHDPKTVGGQAWYAYLRGTTGDDWELIAYLQRAAGYTLTGDTTEEVFFIVYGPKRSGKTTFITALQTILGDMGMSIEADAIMHQRGKGVPMEAVASMLGKRLVSTTEPNEGARFNESMIKQLTGGDRIAGRHLYKDRFEFEPTHKLWMATNTAPKVYDDAMWRRIRRVPFPRTVPPGEMDPRIKAGLKVPRSEIAQAALAWAVEGCLLWRTVGLGTASAVEWDTHEYLVEEDKFGRFIDDECEVMGNLTVTYRDLYDRYKQWCMREGELPMTGTGFARKLQERDFKPNRSVRPVQYVGLALRQGANVYGL